MTERQLGINAFREGRLREAADRLRSAAADHERTVSQNVGFQTYAYLGASLYALGDAAGAADVFSTAVSLYAGKTAPLDLMINLANAYLASGRRHQAEEALTQALSDNPGAMEARILLDRLRNRDQSLPLTGAVFGESPQSVKHYMDTLTFSAVNPGYSPEEVRAALTQIKHYIDTLADHVAEREHLISEQTVEIDRLRRMEETLVENMVQARQETDRLRETLGKTTVASDPQSNGQSSSGLDEASHLTPLEKLFQKKPT